MKKTLISTLLGSMAIIVSCAQTPASGNYSLRIPLTSDEDDFMAYMVDMDSGEKIDSVMVSGGIAIFKGRVEVPRMVRLFVENDRLGSMILEPGDFTFDTDKKQASGGELNTRLEKIGADLDAIVAEFRSLNPSDSASEAKAAEYRARYEKTYADAIARNADNPVGLYLFVDEAMSMDEGELAEALKRYPQFASSKRIAKIKQNQALKKETSPGHKFKDFEIIQPDGTKKRLSDYVGKGKWTLVDFWASWCGPCIRETAVLKELLKEFGPKGLEVVGVAVWDEPDNTLAAITKHELPWPQIINAQTIPTDLYGIQGIPCILLIDPEGNIVSRDKQDRELRDDVVKALGTD